MQSESIQVNELWQDFSCVVNVTERTKDKKGPYKGILVEDKQNKGLEGSDYRGLDLSLMEFLKKNK